MLEPMVGLSFFWTLDESAGGMVCHHQAAARVDKGIAIMLWHKSRGSKGDRSTWSGASQI